MRYFRIFNLRLNRAIATLGLLLLGGLTAGAEITVTTQFNPARIALVDRAQYIVTIAETSNSDAPHPERITSLPLSDSGGLELRNGRISTSRQTNIINFKTEHTVTQQLILDATAPNTGSFTIPAFRFDYKGQSYTVPAATLTVVERSADAAPAVDQLIFLQVEAPKKLYLGQTKVINLKLYVHEQVNFHGYDNITRNADGFTTSELTDPQQSVEMVNGNRYQVLIWPMTITPIQSGPQDLNFETTAVAQVPSANNTRDPFGRNSPFGNNPFGNGIFDDLFGRSERFNLYTEPTQIEVLPLPEEGKPASFTGAIGDFGMQVYADAESTTQGEPIMLSVKITGRGNFDRINGPEMPKSSDWRSYSPESHMEPDASDPLRGIKRFDYVFIPQTSGALMLPEVKFSYFDPETKEYVELKAPPIQVEVSPSLSPQLPPPTPQAKKETPSEQNVPPAVSPTPEEALLALDYRPHPAHTPDFDILHQPAFYWANGLALIVWSAAAIRLRKRRQLQIDGNYALRQAAGSELKLALARAKTAASHNDTESFYRNAQDAVRLAATKRIGRNMRAANLADLEAPLSELGLPDSVMEALRALFSQADTHRFSGRAGTTDIASAQEQLNRILKAL